MDLPLSVVPLLLSLFLPANREDKRERGVESLFLLGGFELLYYLTPSPPNTPPIQGASAVNVYGKNVLNCLPPPFWHYQNLNAAAPVFTALFAPACSTFTALAVRTVHPKIKKEKLPWGLGLDPSIATATGQTSMGYSGSGDQSREIN